MNETQYDENVKVEAFGLDVNTINNIETDEQLDDALVQVFNLPYALRARYVFFLTNRAERLGVAKSFSRLVKFYEELDRRMNSEKKKSVSHDDFDLVRDSDGRIMPTIGNHVKILMHDDYFANVKYNSFKRTAIVESESGETEEWTDELSSRALEYIESKYLIKDRRSFMDALNIFFGERGFHPLKQLVESLVWDGKSRIENFLVDIMKCQDEPYSHEVSRLIFAGGINRLFNPGCKFDLTTVLIGEQGSGKSTIVKWLALEDTYYSEVTTFENRESIECIEGAWICEISEILALKKAREQEGVKAYLTRTVDKYRKPYAQCTESIKRSCIFMATTNEESFLIDKTGNRRYLPINVHTTGRELFEREAEVKEYIAQCWAEAYALYKEQSPKIAPVESMDKEFTAQLAEHRADAVEEDVREGLIAGFLSRKEVGDFTCVLEVWREVLAPDNISNSIPDKKTSNEIGQIISNLSDWKRYNKKGGNRWFSKYNCARKAWVKVKDSEKEAAAENACEEDSKAEGAEF